MNVGAADSRVCDLDIDICLLPWLGLKLLPHHVAIGRRSVQANPALEFVVGRHFCKNWRSLLVLLVGSAYKRTDTEREREEVW